MMRLINVDTLKLETFENYPPKYTILSHRWEKDEVLYNDIVIDHEMSAHKSGWKKLRRFCELTQTLGYTYAWLDTCCIDKASTAELYRAIRSMYMWYAQSDICLAYLGDITHGEDIFQKSVWFTRGWTLQELIAPRRVDFYDSKWTFLGSKGDLVIPISETTGIPPAVLNKECDVQSCSVAQRMSWAAGRETTEPEDRAYSLVGLFDISCVVQYGEGAHNAFLNLQKEIIREFSDESIFAWRWPVNGTRDLIDTGYHGMLASSPDWFGSCGECMPLTQSSQFIYANGVISLKLLTRPVSLETYLALLNVTNEKQKERVSILLARLSAEGEYVRVRDRQYTESWVVEKNNNGYKIRAIAVRQRVTENPPKVFPGFWLRRLEPPGHQKCTPRISSKGKCAFIDRIEMSPDAYGTAGIVCMYPRNQHSETPGWPQVCWFKFGFDDAFNPVCMIANSLVQRNGHIALDHCLFDESLEYSDEAGKRESLRIFQEHWLPADDLVLRKEDTWCQGYIVLKGDRERGLYTVIKDIGLAISIIKCDIQLSSTANIHPPQLETIWTIDIDSTEATEKTTVSALVLCSVWICACLACFCNLLICASLDKNAYMSVASSKSELRCPQVMYHAGHQAWG